MRGSRNRAIQNGWFIVENPMKMDDNWGYPYLWNPHEPPNVYQLLHPLILAMAWHSTAASRGSPGSPCPVDVGAATAAPAVSPAVTADKKHDNGKSLR